MFNYNANTFCLYVLGSFSGAGSDGSRIWGIFIFLKTYIWKKKNLALQ